MCKIMRQAKKLAAACSQLRDTNIKLGVFGALREYEFSVAVSMLPIVSGIQSMAKLQPRLEPIGKVVDVEELVVHCEQNGAWFPALCDQAISPEQIARIGASRPRTRQRPVAGSSALAGRGTRFSYYGRVSSTCTRPAAAKQLTQALAHNATATR
jgi:hypothetical protein